MCVFITSPLRRKQATAVTASMIHVAWWNSSLLRPHVRHSVYNVVTHSVLDIVSHDVSLRSEHPHLSPVAYCQVINYVI